MLASDLKIIDFKANPEKLQTCLEWIKYHCEADPLWGNYLRIDTAQYLQFVGFEFKDTVVCFGGIEYHPDKWGAQIVRTLSKFWIHPEYRTRSLTKWRDDAIKYSPLVLAEQLKFLESRPDITCAMITREGDYLRSFREIVRLANTVSEQVFEIMPGKYNICGDSQSDSCYQFVAVNQIGDFQQARQQGYFNQR